MGLGPDWGRGGTTPPGIPGAIFSIFDRNPLGYQFSANREATAKLASGIVGSNNPNLAKLFAVSTSTNRVCGGDGMGRGVGWKYQEP